MDSSYLNSSENIEAGNILSVSSNEMFTLKEDSDGTLPNIKVEEDEGNFGNNNTNSEQEKSIVDCHENIKQEMGCQLVQSSGDIQFPIFVNVDMNSVKKEEKLSEEQKQLSLQDSKYGITVLKHDIECSVEIDNVLYKSSCGDNIEPNCSNISDNKRKRDRAKRKTPLESGLQDYKTSVIDNRDVCYKESTNVELTSLHSTHKVFKNSKGNCSKNSSKVRSSKGYITSHLKNKYECSECHKVLSDLNSLKRHIDRVHKQIKNHQCDECFRKFFDLAELRMHINGVHKGYFECKECQKKFSGSRELKRHVNVVHRGIKNYQCLECCKRFSKKGHVKMHIDSVHGRIKNYVCNICHTTFYLVSGLQIHIDTVHKGIKNYECNICHKKFPRVNGLNTHINVIHKRITDFECYHCCKMFSTKGVLSKHIIGSHARV